MNSELYDQLIHAQESFHNRAMAIPGVHATSIGLKNVADEATSTLAIVVHVDQKKSLADIPEAERIPAQLEGLPTDVVEDGAPYPLLGPLQGGADLRVGNFAGTLGCIVRDMSDKTTCLLSNQHVLDNVGTTVYVQKNDACHKVGYTKRTAQTSTVDAAIASILDGIATSASIAEIGNVAGSRSVTWQDIGKTVRKMGRTTGLRYGTINGMNYQGTTSLGGPTQSQVIIVPLASKNSEFAAPGDSGSVIVDENNFVVALLWGKSQVGETVYANKIENVMSALNIEILTASTADAPLAHAETFVGQLEGLCAGSTRGQGYLKSYVERRDAIQHLFHENARLYAIWNKIPQDEFMDAIRAGVRHPDGTIPAMIGNEDTLSVLTQLREAVAGYVQDAEFVAQMDELYADIASHIGGSWQEALAEQPADAAVAAPSRE
ncbi:MAG: hypothetical protein WBX27_08710 [Specibacter sp.]